MSSSLDDYKELINDIIDNNKPINFELGVFYNQVVIAYQFVKCIPGIEDTHIVKFKKQLLRNIESILVYFHCFGNVLEVEWKDSEC